MDSAGNIYVIGGWIPEVPSPLNSPQVYSLRDVFVSKLDLSGSIVWLTYLGGRGDNVAKGIAVDAAPPLLQNALLRLLQSSKPHGVLRDHVEEVVAGTHDIDLLLPLLLGFEVDLTAYRNLFQNWPSLEQNIQKKRERQEHLLASFNSQEGDAIRNLFGILCECQALPHRSDYARLELRRKAVEPARRILDRAPSVLAAFADVFAADEEGQTDLVYVICCLPRPGALPFLKSELKREGISALQHAVFALALSYVTDNALPDAAQGMPLVAPSDGNAARTWWGDEGIEKTCHEACTRSAVNLGRVFESSPKLHEERLTGIFLVKLQTEMQRWATGVEAWAAKRFGRYSSVHCSHEDVAANGPEKVWGADIGFYLSVRAHGVLTAERAFLAQAKKARVFAQGNELSWTIDRVQRDILIGQSSWSVYFLYGCYKTGNGIRVVPASAVRDVMVGASTKTQISAANAVSITRPFAEFFTYDFLADWWGDCDGRALDIVRGRVGDFPVRALGATHRRYEEVLESCAQGGRHQSTIPLSHLRHRVPLYFSPRVFIRASSWRFSGTPRFPSR